MLTATLSGLSLQERRAAEGREVQVVGVGPHDKLRKGEPVVDRSQLKNAFEFVAVASARARQLMNGCVPKVEVPKENAESAEKPARVAQREVAEGHVKNEAEN